MRRTKGVEITTNNKKLHTFASELVGRMLFASQLGGQQYGGARDLYQALGYKLILEFDDYLSKYLRHDIAKAIIDRPVKATWQGAIELVESERAEETPFEKEWRKLDRKLGLKSRFSQVDRLTGIGRYGVILLGLDDVSNQEGFSKPVKTNSNRKLLYVKAFSERSAKIDTYDEDPHSSRYGKPQIYGIEVGGAYGATSATVRVHHSRVIHIIDDTLESDVFGIPRLEAVFNRLMDIDKVVGGDAEMFWRGARPGYDAQVDKEYTMTKEQEDKLMDQIDEYENNLRRILVNEGITLKELAQQIADPKNHLDILLTCISAVTGIPKRILSGSERGELASTQDAGEWKTFVQSRREDHAEPRILRMFVDRILELGIIPAPEDEYTVKWLDLFSISEKDRVDIGKSRANAIREYTTNPLASSIIPPAAFLEYCLGFDTGQIQLIDEMIKVGISAEQKELMKIIEDITTPEPKIPAGRLLPEKQPVKVVKTVRTK